VRSPSLAASIFEIPDLIGASGLDQPLRTIPLRRAKPSVSKSLAFCVLDDMHKRAYASISIKEKS
jgi:hypothetical protein